MAAVASTHWSADKVVADTRSERVPSGSSLVPVLIEKLAEFASLQDGWDSYRAKAPTMKAILLAFFFVNQCTRELTASGRRVELAPLIDGGVVFTISEGSRSIDVNLTNEPAITVERSDGEEYNAKNFGEVADHLRWLARG